MFTCWSRDTRTTHTNMWTPPPSQPQFYGRVSPPSQMNTMSPLQQQFNTSPTGSVHHHRIPPTFRQLHPPKSPLYRPAVLRAIDRPLTSVISSPAGSPKLLSEEYESEYRREGDISSEDGYDQDFDEEICEEDDGVRCTGPPVRTHWKPDASATVCDSPSCIREFGTWIRKHHCRRCGNVFCFEHVPYYLPLSQNGRMHPRGVRSKVCDGCFNDYRQLRAAKRNDSLSSQSTSSTLSNSSPIVTRGIRPIAGAGAPDNALSGKVGSYVGSVPRDWSWSTF